MIQAPPTMDLIAPPDAERSILGVSLASTAALHVTRPITVLFDYSATGQYGVTPPLDLVVFPFEGTAGYFHKTFRNVVPDRYTFTVPASGQYLVVLKERFHNKHFGKVTITVLGDPIIDIPLTRR